MNELALLALSGGGRAWVTKRTHYRILIRGFLTDVLDALLVLAALDQALVLPLVHVVALAPVLASLAALLRLPRCVAFRNKRS